MRWQWDHALFDHRSIIAAAAASADNGITDVQAVDSEVADVSMRRSQSYDGFAALSGTDSCVASIWIVGISIYVDQFGSRCDHLIAAV